MRKLLQHFLSFLFTPVILVGYVFQFFSFYFDYGRSRGHLHMHRLFITPEREKELIAKAKQAAIDQAQQMFPGARITERNGVIHVDDPDADPSPAPAADSDKPKLH